MNAVDQENIDAISSKVISSTYRVSNSLGAGFLEKVYENAMVVELRHAGIPYQQQAGIDVRCRSEIVGQYVPDLVVADAIILEIKAVDTLNRVHQAHSMNYLPAPGINVAHPQHYARPRLALKRLLCHF
jgi:GxxExxY protein